MHEQFSEEISQAEQADAALCAIDQEVAEAQGALEAVGEFLVGDEPYELPEHQSRLVDIIRSRNASLQKQTLAVIDLKTANEGIAELLDTVGKKAIGALVAQVPKQLLATEAALRQYLKLSGTTYNRLARLRALLEKTGDASPAVRVFSLGAQKRFFQTAGVEIADFDMFAKTFSRQCRLANHGFVNGAGYSLFIADKIVKDLQRLQVPQAKDLREDLRKSITFHWINVWKDGFKSDVVGRVPAAFIAEHPDCKTHAVCALFDARVVVATEPRKSMNAAHAGKYRAAVAFDKQSPVKPSGELLLPGSKEMLTVVDKAMALMNDMHYYKELADKCGKLAKEFSTASKVVLDNLDKRIDAKSLDAAMAYMQVVGTCSQLLSTPHAQLAWMHVRASLVVAAMAEQVLTDAEHEHIVTKRFFSKQSTQFAVALESYVETSALLATAHAQLPTAA